MSPKRILIAVDDFTTSHLERIQQTVGNRAELVVLPQNAPETKYRAALRNAEVAVGWPKADWLIDTPVKFLQIGSSGWDDYQNKGLEEHGIALCNGRGKYSVGVAEHAIGMMMALVRRIPAHVRDKDERKFRRHLPYPSEIAGSTALIVGLGDIGTELAKRCKGLEMKTVAIVRRPREPSESVHEMVLLADLKTAVQQADHIFLTMPGSVENINLFSRDVLTCAKPTAYLYNLSRGTTIDEPALFELLRDNKLAGAGLDVTTVEPLPEDSPLWKLGDNVLITGHSAGLSTGHTDRFCQLVCRNLNLYLTEQSLENRVL
ncbi:D-2-hydroxyacid dehydrogenase [Larkinella terrae]|nr:D-2-hydroxyacid dehydrogenase [Larkinella terrae]